MEEAMRRGGARAAVLFLAALSLASPLAFASPYHPFDAQPATAGTGELVTETGNRIAQSFTPTADYTLTRVALHVQDRNNSDVLEVNVVPDAGGLPNIGTVLASASNDTSPAYVWSNFTLTPAVPLLEGVPYWIVARSNGGNTHGYGWRYTPTDVYPRGSAASRVSGSWTLLPGDLAFLAYGWTPANLTVAVAGDRTTVASGDALALRVDLDNAGTEDATDVWVNATLDPRFRFDRIVGPGAATVAGPLVSVRIPGVPQGPSLLEIVSTAGPLLDDGGDVTIPVTVEFTDVGGRRSHASGAILEVLAPRVEVGIQLPPGPATAEPGGVVTFVLAYENLGRLPAKHVWLNGSLHPALTYLSDDASTPPTRTGNSQSWHLQDVPPGRSSFNVTVQVDPRAPGDTMITHFLTHEHTDALGAGLLRGRSNTVWLQVVPAPEPGGGNPWLWGSFAISASIVAGAYLLLARRRLQAEELFLIHQSGVLLVHMSKTMKSDEDSDLLSGMFTAILNFVKDAFQYDPGQELHGLDLGPNRVLVRKGAVSYLAIVHSGKPRRWISRAAESSLREIEAKYGEMLADWDGDVRALAGVREILKDYFLSPTGPSRSMRWLRGTLGRAAQTFKPT